MEPRRSARLQAKVAARLPAAASSTAGDPPAASHLPAAPRTAVAPQSLTIPYPTIASQFLAESGLPFNAQALDAGGAQVQGPALPTIPPRPSWVSGATASQKISAADRYIPQLRALQINSNEWMRFLKKIHRSCRNEDEKEALRTGHNRTQWLARKVFKKVGEEVWGKDGHGWLEDNSRNGRLSFVEDKDEYVERFLGIDVRFTDSYRLIRRLTALLDQMHAELYSPSATGNIRRLKQKSPTDGNSATTVRTGFMGCDTDSQPGHTFRRAEHCCYIRSPTRPQCRLRP